MTTSTESQAARVASMRLISADDPALRRLATDYLLGTATIMGVFDLERAARLIEQCGINVDELQRQFEILKAS